MHFQCLYKKKFSTHYCTSAVSSIAVKFIVLLLVSNQSLWFLPYRYNQVNFNLLSNKIHVFKFLRKKLLGFFSTKKRKKKYIVLVLFNLYKTSVGWVEVNYDEEEL
uniref:Uncharacterized protein n=1 Tax=Cacopsylla melanoneura TaxID=428564 RepID=A0A8D8MFB5_9HEMI